MPFASRTDSWPPAGGPPGSDLNFLRRQLLDAWPIDIGVLNTLITIRNQERDYDDAMATAANACQIAEWLEPEPRLRASLLVPFEDAALAVAEIERRGADRRFVQVLIPSRTSQPLGQRKYWPIFAAAAAHGLPIGIHFGGWSGGHPISGAGWPAYYLEYHTGMSQTFQAQLISLICEGVFEEFPGLKIVFIEGGLGWIAPLLWRLDRSWRQLRAETPRLSQLPSDCFRRHFWLTTQPVEEPPEPPSSPSMLSPPRDERPPAAFHRLSPLGFRQSRPCASLGPSARRAAGHPARQRLRAVRSGPGLTHRHAQARGRHRRGDPPGGRKIVEIQGRSLGIFPTWAAGSLPCATAAPTRGAPLCEEQARRPAA